MRGKNFTAIILASLITLTLAGCGGKPQIQEETTKIACGMTNAGSSLCSYRVPIGETRHVTCVGLYNGGLSCDWAHADGADQGRTQ